MRISTFIPLTNSIKRGDTFIEAIKSHLFFSDELVVVDGGSTDGTIEAIKEIGDNRIRIETLPWPEVWSWKEFATHWNFGYQACTGDWVAAGETDHIFNEKDVEKVRGQLADALDKGFAVMHINKMQSSLVTNWGGKARFPYFLNKKDYGSRIGYGLDRNRHTDLAYPIWVLKELEPLFYEGKALNDNEMQPMSCNFYNYLWTFKTWDMVFAERKKSSRAWNMFEPFLVDHERSMPWTDEGIKKSLVEEMKGKHERNTLTFGMQDHPKIMQEKIERDLKPGMFGYDLCGIYENTF